MNVKLSRHIIPAISIILLVACSASNIAKRGEYIDEKSIIKGLPRVDILARFGSPIETNINEDGKKVDLFRVEQGENTAGKIIKGTGTTALAIFTLGLSELVASPVTENQPMVVFEVFYDKNDRVEKVNFIQLPK